MIKIVKKFIFYPLQFIVFLKIYYLFRIIPNSSASNFGEILLKIIGPLTRSHKITIFNLKKIFPKKNDGQLLEIAKNSWGNLGRTVAEFAHLNNILDKKNDYIKVEGSNFLRKIVYNKEQAIFIAIHQANWEILAPIIGDFGIKINSVYRHINNPLIDRFILNLRKNAYKSSNSILSPKGKKSASDMLKSIKKGFSIALLIDQKDSAGIEVPLMGSPAKSQIGFIKLSKKFKLKIYPIESKRLDKTKFKIIVHKPLELFNDKKTNEINIMKKIHDIIGKWIKDQPENWLWQHNRWG